jgi:hypothetical protein
MVRQPTPNARLQLAFVLERPDQSSNRCVIMRLPTSVFGLIHDEFLGVDQENILTANILASNNLHCHN